MAPFSVFGHTLNTEDEGSSKPGHAMAYILVRAKDLLNGEQIAQLVSLGVTTRSRAESKTYLCRFGGDDLGQIRSLPFVDFADEYRAELKVSPDLNIVPADGAAPPGRLEITIFLHDDAPEKAQAVADTLVERGLIALDETVVYPPRHINTVADAGALIKIAAPDSVLVVERRPEMVRYGDLSRQVLVDQHYVDGNTELTGAGQKIAVADSGFDMRVDSIPPQFRRRPDGSCPIQLVDSIFGPGGPTTDQSGHGTAVCGLIVADGRTSVPGLGPRIRGSAPGASLYVTRIYDNEDKHYKGPNSDILNQALSHGATIFNASWGPKYEYSGDRSNSEHAYRSSARDIDAWYYKNPECLGVWAAGNHGAEAGNGFIYGPPCAKNIITVGACHAP